MVNGVNVNCFSLARFAHLTPRPFKQAPSRFAHTHTHGHTHQTSLPSTRHRPRGLDGVRATSEAAELFVMRSVEQLSHLLGLAEAMAKASAVDRASVVARNEVLRQSLVHEAAARAHG